MNEHAIKIEPVDKRPNFQKMCQSTEKGFLWTTTASNFQAAIHQNDGDPVIFCKAGVDLRGAIAGEEMTTIDIATTLSGRSVEDLKKSFVDLLFEKIKNDVEAFNHLMKNLEPFIGKDEKPLTPVKSVIELCDHRFLLKGE